MDTTETGAPPRPKPKLRGVPHLIGAIVALPSVVLLAHSARPGLSTIGAGVFGASLVLLLSTSALYHTPMWTVATRMKLRLVDRSMIFVLIAGTYTPFLLELEDKLYPFVLEATWIAAALGISVTLFARDKPRWMTAFPYVVLGWGGLLLMPTIFAHLGTLVFWLIVAGGVAYTAGALVYARRRPDPAPAVFGYHEIFHVLVLGAALCHYLATWRIVV